MDPFAAYATKGPSYTGGSLSGPGQDLMPGGGDEDVSHAAAREALGTAPLGVTDELPAEAQQQATQEAARIATGLERSLLLAKDDLQVPNQKYAVVSFVSAQSRQRLRAGGEDDLRALQARHQLSEAAVADIKAYVQEALTAGMKIRGVFGTLEEAKAQARMLAEYDPTYDLFVQELYGWALVPPDPEAMANVEYADKRLDQLIRTHQEQKIKKDLLYKERQRRLVAQVPATQEVKPLE